jgi:hypothetical protein
LLIEEAFSAEVDGRHLNCAQVTQTGSASMPTTDRLH